MSTQGPEDEWGPAGTGGAVEEQGRLRDQAARRRDAAAHRRDEGGMHRDQVANTRDATARRRPERREQTDAAGIDSPEATEAERQLAALDRVAAAEDRSAAAADRQQALADRMAAARDRRSASLDGLTGTYNRYAGVLQLRRDVARAARAGHLLVVAFIDLDHLKMINDTQGHAAGDRALTAVAQALLTAVRPYDLVIRYGGDEFLCAVEGIDAAAARLRFSRVNQLLGDSGVDRVSVTVGLAEMQPGETPDALIARADADLYQQRRQR